MPRGFRSTGLLQHGAVLLQGEVLWQCTPLPVHSYVCMYIHTSRCWEPYMYTGITCMASISSDPSTQRSCRLLVDDMMALHHQSAIGIPRLVGTLSIPTSLSLSLYLQWKIPQPRSQSTVSILLHSTCMHDAIRARNPHIHTHQRASVITP